MNNKEILEIAKQENCKENFENEVIKTGNYWATRIGIILIALFSVLEYFVTNFFNFGYFSIWFLIESTLYIYKSLKVKEKFDIVRAVLYCILALLFTTLFILRLTKVI